VPESTAAAMIGAWLGLWICSAWTIAPAAARSSLAGGVSCGKAGGGSGGRAAPARASSGESGDLAATGALRVALPGDAAGAGGGAGAAAGSSAGAEIASGSRLRFSASSIASIACVTGSEAELFCAMSPPRHLLRVLRDLLRVLRAGRDGARPLPFRAPPRALAPHRERELTKMQSTARLLGWKQGRTPNFKTALTFRSPYLKGGAPLERRLGA